MGIASPLPPAPARTHAHLAVHRRRRGEMLLRLLALARAPVELAEAEVAVGDEGAHAARLGERQRLAVMGLAALGIEPVGMGRDVAEQVQRMGREPGVALRGFERAVAQAPRLVEPAEHQTRRDPAHGRTSRGGRRIRSPPDARGAARLPCSRFSASLASPSCASAQAEEATAEGRWRSRFPARDHRDRSARSAERACAQSPLRRWSMPAAKWARPTVNACCVGSASRIASASCSAASANRPSSARLMISQPRS